MPKFQVQIWKDGRMTASMVELAGTAEQALRKVTKAQLHAVGEPEELAARVRPLPKGDWVDYFLPKLHTPKP